MCGGVFPRLWVSLGCQRFGGEIWPYPLHCGHSADDFVRPIHPELRHLSHPRVLPLHELHFCHNSTWPLPRHLRHLTARGFGGGLAGGDGFELADGSSGADD